MITDGALLELLYDGVADDSAWTAALARIANAARASGAGLGVQDMRTHEFWAVAQSGIDPALHATYQRLAPENRIWQEISRAGRPMADHMVLPKAEFLRSALYAEWFAPQEFDSVMAAPVMANGSHCGVVVTFGSKQRGEFEQADLDGLAHVAGHLNRALGLRLEWIRLNNELQARNNALDELDEGVLLLDGKFCVLHASAVGQALLAQQDGIFLRNGRLACRDPQDDRDLQRALLPGAATGATPSEGWIIAHRRTRRPLLIRVTNLQRGNFRRLVGSAIAMVRVEDPDRPRLPTPAVLKKLLGVTLGEAKAMLAVARADTQDEAAAQLGVAKTTLRTQLHHAYQKLGLHDRAELLGLFAVYRFRQAQGAA